MEVIMYKKIEREELKKKLNSDENVHLVEVLSEKEYERLHIKGAEHIQFGDIVQEAKKRFDPNDTIIVYCADQECSASPTAAKKLDSVEFSNVYDYEAGKADWKAAGYPMEGTEA
jgi:rhodanese-related sulfurtransferase